MVAGAVIDRDYQALEFAYRRSPDQQASAPAFHDVVVVGAGPVGLALAIDLAQRGLAGTRAFVSDLYASVQAGAGQGTDLPAIYRETHASLSPKYGQWVIFDHCMPFDVTRALDEATAHPDPRIWTAERDKAMWASLEA